MSELKAIIRELLAQKRILKDACHIAIEQGDDKDLNTRMNNLNI